MLSAVVKQMEKHHTPAARSRTDRILALLLLSVCLFLILLPFLSRKLHPVLYIRSEHPTLEVRDLFVADGEVDETTHTLKRGTPVRILRRSQDKSEIEWNGISMEIDNDHLCGTIAQAIAVDTVYPRRRIELRSSRQGPLSGVSAAKGEALQVVAASPSDLELETGEILWYQVEKDGKTYWIGGQSVEWSQEDALKDWSKDLQINPFFDGQTWEGFSKEQYVQSVDLKGWSQPDFEDNPRRSDLKGIHITLENLMKHKEEIFSLKEEDGINALVIAFKGPSGQIWYESEVPSRYFLQPSHAKKNAIASRSEVASLLRQCKERGFYVIGRLETFQDSLAAADNPDFAITDADNKPVAIGGSYWLSPYSRRNWQYNTDLAIELAHLGVQEIQFDFCRFPEGIAADESTSHLDVKNAYGEGKTEAISNFLYFAREQLEPLHVYTSLDMYAGPVLDQYDYGIGHFYPAMLAAANYVCPMAYLDSFASMAQNQQTDVYAQADAVIASFVRDAKSQQPQVFNAADLRFWLQGWGFADDSIVLKQLEGMQQTDPSSVLFWTDEGDPEILELVLPALSTQP